jgi:hypothetical protein
MTFTWAPFQTQLRLAVIKVLAAMVLRALMWRKSQQGKRETEHLQKGKERHPRKVFLHHIMKSSRTSMGSELADYLASNAEYMRYMMKSDHEHMKIQQKCENRQDEKEAAGARAAQVEARVRNAREVLANEAMPDDMKEVARKVLLDYFTNAN